MKKITTILTFILVLLALVVGCSQIEYSDNTVPTEKPSTSTISTEKPAINNDLSIETIDISTFEEAKPSSYNVGVYRNEVKQRLNTESGNVVKEDEFFIINELIKTQTLINSGTYIKVMDSINSKEISRYYYPVVFRDGESLFLWYTTEDGELIITPLLGEKSETNSGEEQCKVHYSPDIIGEVISEKYSHAVTYIKETGEIRIHRFDEIVDYFDKIPTSAEYCGFSNLYGYIFKKVADVYSLKSKDTFLLNDSLDCIAHHVKHVIKTDYKYDSTYWSQPMFQMLDGDIVVYVRWGSGKPDSSMFLLPLESQDE